MPDLPIPESEIADETTADSTRLKDKHHLAMTRFDSVAVPQAPLRAQSLEARRFVTIPGAMYEGAFGEQFENAPRLEMDEVTPGLEKIETDYRENRLTVDFIPAGGQDKETADTLDGMYRADSYHFNAQAARDNAFKEGIRGGFGAWRLTTDRVDPYDPDDDSQRVNPGMTIPDADQCVYLDGASVEYDGSDAKWAHVLSAWPRADAEDKWPDAVWSDFPTAKWDYAWDGWYRPDLVMTSEYYEVEDTGDKLLIFTSAQGGDEQRFFASEIGDGVRVDLKAQGYSLGTRTVKRRRVHKYLMNGSVILRDCGYIAGDSIPIVPFYFRRDWIDNMPWWRGYVGKKMDAQRSFNSAMSHLTEIDSLSPYEVPIIADEQMTPEIANEWARGNIDRHPFRRIKPLRDPEGNVISAGPIGKIEPPQVPPVTVTRLQFALQVLRGDEDTADQVKSNVSADAMDIAATRVDAKSGIPLDNMRLSIAREGQIYLGMGREVYYEPGREVETLTNDGQDGTATLAEPMVDQSGVYRIRNDLTRGKFKVLASVQESTATKRQKTVRQALELASAFGQGTPDAQAALYTAAQSMDGEGIDDLQEFYRQRSIAVGATKPTQEEQQRMQQAAENQQPDPAAVALTAQAAKLGAEAEASKAKAVESLSKAHLNQAQADTLEKAPKVPSGLSAPPENPLVQAAEVHSKIASADLNTAKAAHLREDIVHKRIKTGHQVAMERRAQDLAESAPQGQA